MRHNKVPMYPGIFHLYTGVFEATQLALRDDLWSLIAFNFTDNFVFPRQIGTVRRDFDDHIFFDFRFRKFKNFSKRAIINTVFDKVLFLNDRAIGLT